MIPGWVLGFGLAAFWAVPVFIRTFGGLNTDMGWTPLTGIRGAGISNVGTPLTNEFIPIFALGVVGMVWTLLRREDVRVLITMTVVPFLGYLLIAEQGWTILYNARLLPYWFMGMFLFAGITVGLATARVARFLPNRKENIVVGGVLAIALSLAVTIIGVHDIPGWVNWNYQGYEGKAVYPELAALMEDVNELPSGRVMWEYNKEIQEQYGTPMALMLIPYWTENHETMEGVFFESSLTTPFHFLNQAEMSRSPSQPVRGITYRTFALDRGIEHSKLYNIDYYITQTEAMTGEAARLGLEPLVEEEGYSIFRLPETSAVDIASVTPMVYEGEDDFRDVALAWYDEIDTLDQWIVAEGPEEWPRFDDILGPYDAGLPVDTTGAAVSDIVVEDHSISFTTNAVGVPHLVKTSYFPNWAATGADGPYRAAPSLMVVVPTQEQVSLEFAPTWTENLGMVLTIAALGFLVWWRRQSVHGTSQQDGEV